MLVSLLTLIIPAPLALGKLGILLEILLRMPKVDKTENSLHAFEEKKRLCYLNNSVDCKIVLSSSKKKKCVICSIESLLKMMKNVFYFILKAIFILKIFKFLY